MTALAPAAPSGLVRSDGLLRQYSARWTNLLDLIQEGNVGLVKALEKFDPSRGVRFSYYAKFWIRAMIFRYLMDNFRMVRLGTTRDGRRLFFELQKERRRLADKGIEPTLDTLATELNIDRAELVRMDQRMRAPDMSLDTPVTEGVSVGDTLVHTDDSPELQVASSHLSDQVNVQLEIFSETLLKDDRERTIWSKRLVSDDPKSLAELGREYEVSKERIRQLENRIKLRLKDFLVENLGHAVAMEFAAAS